MEPTFDKTKVKQDLKQEDRKERKHEGARETRPERPVPAEGETQGHDQTYKRDEEQDKKIPHEKRDEEQPKVLTGKANKGGNKPPESKPVVDDDAPDMAETESSNVVKTEPDDDDEAPSQGI